MWPAILIRVTENFKYQATLYAKNNNPEIWYDVLTLVFLEESSETSLVINNREVIELI